METRKPDYRTLLGETKTRAEVLDEIQKDPQTLKNFKD